MEYFNNFYLELMT